MNAKNLIEEMLAGKSAIGAYNGFIALCVEGHNLIESISAEFQKIIPEFEAEIAHAKPTTDKQKLRIIANFIENSEGKPDVEWMLHKLAIPYKEIEWHSADSVFVFGKQSDTWVIDGIEDAGPEIKHAQEWVDEIEDHKLDAYVQLPEDDFWGDIGSHFLMYHATKKSNLDSILKNGLQTRNETRGIANRSVGKAIFLGPDEDSVQMYGDAVLSVDLSAMKRDRYMPSVDRETGISENEQRQSIAHKLGFDYYQSDERGWDGIVDSTVVMFGNIPAKYLKVVQE